MNNQTKKNFLRLIQIRNQKENLIILPLKDEKSIRNAKIELNNNKLIKELVEKKKIKSYLTAIAKYWNTNLPETNREQLTNIEQDIGHTSNLKNVEISNTFKIFGFKKNETFTWDLDEKELDCLIKRMKTNRLLDSIQQAAYLKRQLLKKAFFNDLHVLINLDVIYETELNNINKFLEENDFQFTILKPNSELNKENEDEVKLFEIELYNHKTKCHLKLNDLRKSDYLKLYLLLIKRDRDLIKFNAEKCYQVLLINEIDSLCEYDKQVIEYTITLVRNYLVNYMNIQVVSTINCPELLLQTNNVSELIMEIYQKNSAIDEVSLRKYETAMNTNILDERKLLIEKKERIDESLKSTIKLLKEENLNFKNENESLKADVNKKDQDISIVSEERDRLLRDKLSSKIETVNDTGNQVVHVSRMIESSSKLSFEINDFIKKHENQSKIFIFTNFC